MGNAFALKPVILRDSQPDYNIAFDQLDIFEDASGKYTFSTISDAAFSQFKISKEKYPYAENINSIYWIRVKVQNKTTKAKRWVFEVFSNHIQDLTMYIPTPEGGYTISKTGQNFKFIQRDYDVINPVFDIPSLANASYYIYLRIATKNNSSFDFHIRTQNYFAKYATKEYWLLGFYYGILAFVMVYFCIMFLITKEKLYLFYVFYLFSCAFYSLVDDGIGFEFIWANIPEFNNLLNSYLASSLFLISFVIYAKFFVGIGDRFPRLNIWVLLTSSVCLLIQFYDFFADISLYFYFVPFILVYIASVKAYLKGVKSVRFFIIGQSLLLFSMLVLRLSWTGILEANVFTVYIFNVSVVLEALIFSYAFVDRFNLLKKQHDLAQINIIKQLEENELLQTKVNRELEEKVHERTLALKNESEKLEEAHHKLEGLMAQVNDMNSKLDYDNWQLKKNVTEEKKARVVSEQIPYEEFVKVYTTDFACFKYLEELKWSVGYVCKKCGNDKYIYLQKNLSRRCTKCAYIESATNGTIFQGLKFPITKAFYIVYYCSLDIQKLTVDELSALLELRRNTCWSFRKRVLEVKTTLFSTGKIKSKNIFNALILQG